MIAAPAPVLQEWAATLIRLGERTYRGMGYKELDRPNGNGEVQIFNDFPARVSSAVVTRRRLFPGRDHVELTDDERSTVWAATSPTVGLPNQR